MNEKFTKKQDAPQSETKKKQDSGLKTIFTGVIVFVALILGYNIMTQQSNTMKYDVGDATNMATYAATLENSNITYIVMDLRNAQTDLQRGNIMQCGTDFAGSVGLVEKELRIYAIEGNRCTSISGDKDVSDCIKQATEGVSIFIRSGNQTVILKNRLIVGIGDEYKFKSCSIDKK